MIGTDRTKGFTLMELLVVVGIITILSVAGVTNYVFSLKKSHDAQRKSNLSTIARALEAFNNDFGGYPADDGNGKMVACDYNNTGLRACEWGAAMAAFPAGRSSQVYLTKIPKDPIPTQSYYYERTTTGFYLYAALENTADPYYKSGLSVSCGTGVSCSYQLSEAGAL